MPPAPKDSFPGKHDAGAKQAERGAGPICLSFGIIAAVAFASFKHQVRLWP